MMLSVACSGVHGKAAVLKSDMAGAVDTASWWDVLCTPSVVTRFLIYAAPSTAKAEVAGLSISLRSYDARQPQPSQQPQSAASAASSSHAAPPPSFSFGVPASSAAAQPLRTSGASNAEQPFRRRKRFRAVAVPEAGASSGASASLAPARATPLERDFPVEEHMLVQQWGFSLTVRVMPPLWSEPEEGAALQGKAAQDPRPSMYTNPLYASEETSTSSYSDTGEPKMLSHLSLHGGLVTLHKG
jgi:hypothetical protein